MVQASMKGGWPGRVTRSGDRDSGTGEDSALLPWKKTLRWRHLSYLQNLKISTLVTRCRYLD